MPLVHVSWDRRIPFRLECVPSCRHPALDSPGQSWSFAALPKKRAMQLHGCVLWLVDIQVWAVLTPPQSVHPLNPVETSRNTLTGHINVKVGIHGQITG